MNLNTGWTLRAARGEPRLPIPVAVPGDVHAALRGAGLIPDPFFDTQVEDCRWVENVTWIYETSFVLESAKAERRFELVFDGIDTFAAVSLNGHELGRTANMFHAHEFDVTHHVKPGTNFLSVVIDPVKAHVPSRPDPRMWYSYDTDRAWARKAQYGWRWDWGPRLLTAGLWQGVSLVESGRGRITSTQFQTLSIDQGQARVAVTVEARGAQPGDRVTVALSEQGPFEAPLVEGSARFEFVVEDAKLWWTHDLGTPFLYTLEVTLAGPEGTLDQLSQSVGIRTIELRQELEGRKVFQLVLNGVGIFARGSNWIPAHSLVGTVTAADDRAWVDLARQGNHNLLRVWGGGVYETTAFYEECDRQGVLVWQDFAFACSSYPDHDEAFVALVEAEVKAVARRLRNHPSLALWCGNNEIQWIHEQKERERPEDRLYGRTLWEELIPLVLDELDATRPYWPSSPFGGVDPNSDDEGDKHNWQVWAGQIYPQVKGQGVQSDNSTAGVSFKHFAHDEAKFCSEFGLHAYPVIETLRACLPSRELAYGSFGLKFRNKDKRPNRGRLLMEGYSGLPRDLTEAIDLSMLTQAEGLRFGVEHYRRRRPDCSGALVWQLNDCWPTLSWSVVDFYRRPKAGYWALKRAFAPRLLSWKDEPKGWVSLWAVNDSLQSWATAVEVQLLDFFGNSISQNQLSFEVPALAAVEVGRFSKNLLNVTYTNFEYLAARPSEGLTVLHLLEDHKDLNLPPAELTVEFVSAGEESVWKVSANRFARLVRLEGDLDGSVLDDNYFDLEAGRPRTVRLKGASRSRELVLRALNAPAVRLDGQ